MLGRPNLASPILPVAQVRPGQPALRPHIVAQALILWGQVEIGSGWATPPIATPTWKEAYENTCLTLTEETPSKPIVWSTMFGREKITNKMDDFFLT
ncbi:hypothetical protein AMTR_s00056p00151160 [Amborella trichopoda]|uniref:Uncharacterized protein n=1 Tax=Amborella trichopoda TaxID=13333 RepID=U5D1A7_AMBTC|nr:hypothetical protein AMTR_s00056p00151160 [Amborella trichopoda]